MDETNDISKLDEQIEQLDEVSKLKILTRYTLRQMTYISGVTK